MDYWVITVAGWGTIYGYGTEEDAETMRVHKARWERAVARKRLANVDEITLNTFIDLADHVR